MANTNVPDELTNFRSLSNGLTSTISFAPYDTEGLTSLTT